MKRIFSGIQPTGIPHLGNYFGAIKPWQAMQKQDRMMISIVDLHAITVPQNPTILKENIQDMAASLLACGITTDNILFRQSKVPQHASLAWILFCQTPIGWLNRLHQWQQKSGEEKHLGLLSYPVLQAADILLYKATHVPVGDDQSQHMNLATMLTKKFNSTFNSQVFPIPRAIYPSNESKRIMSLRDPIRKMSKSDPSPASTILITDEDEVIRRKLMKATADSVPGIFEAEDRPGINNLLNILQSLRTQKMNVEKELKALSHREFKELVANEVIAALKPIRERYIDLKNDLGYIENILEKGEAEARELAQCTLEEVYRCIGFTK